MANTARAVSRAFPGVVTAVFLPSCFACHGNSSCMCAGHHHLRDGGAAHGGGHTPGCVLQAQAAESAGNPPCQG
ncbi:hypothetical protein HaLaN_06217, partial [Haematococcus lacustris]